mmetsp:Transcript_17140/g.29358  ORF Transcript_17140/g.29358 Transcript_17140/m.29358 type:complete len:246 (+) Transcript_17140:108-845(+)
MTVSSGDAAGTVIVLTMGGRGGSSSSGGGAEACAAAMATSARRLAFRCAARRMVEATAAVVSADGDISGDTGICCSVFSHSVTRLGSATVAGLVVAGRGGGGGGVVKLRRRACNRSAGVVDLRLWAVALSRNDRRAPPPSMTVSSGEVAGTVIELTMGGRGGSCWYLGAAAVEAALVGGVNPTAAARLKAASTSPGGESFRVGGRCPGERGSDRLGDRSLPCDMASLSLFSFFAFFFFFFSFFLP